MRREGRIHVQARRDRLAAPHRDTTKQWNSLGPFPRLLVCFHLFHMEWIGACRDPLIPAPQLLLSCTYKGQSCSPLAKYAFDAPLFIPSLLPTTGMYLSAPFLRKSHPRSSFSQRHMSNCQALRCTSARWKLSQEADPLLAKVKIRLLHIK